MTFYILERRKTKLENLLLEFGLKDGIFVGLFIWLLIYVLNNSKEREDKLYMFLDEMKIEFAKLVESYESLSKDVNKIRQELHEFKDNKN